MSYDTVTYIVGVIGAALLFALFTLLRPGDKRCAGQCVGCTRDGACDAKRAIGTRGDGRSLG